MANYICAIRTNYFHVKDPEQFKAFMARVCGTEDDIELWEEPDVDGNPTFAFGTEGGIAGLLPLDSDTNESEDDDPDYSNFILGLQDLLADDDAVILLEIGREKLRYLVGRALILTKRHNEYLNIRDIAIAKACQLLGNPEWNTCIEY